VSNQYYGHGADAERWLAVYSILFGDAILSDLIHISMNLRTESGIRVGFVLVVSAAPIQL
jgi:hypothetical protein